MRPSADDSWFRLSLEIGVSFQWSRAESFNLLEFCFMFNIFWGLVEKKKKPSKGAG